MDFRTHNMDFLSVNGVMQTNNRQQQAQVAGAPALTNNGYMSTQANSGYMSGIATPPTLNHGQMRQQLAGAPTNNGYMSTDNGDMSIATAPTLNHLQQMRQGNANATNIWQPQPVMPAMLTHAAQLPAQQQRSPQQYAISMTAAQGYPSPPVGSAQHAPIDLTSDARATPTPTMGQRGYSGPPTPSISPQERPVQTNIQRGYSGQRMTSSSPLGRPAAVQAKIQRGYSGQPMTTGSSQGRAGQALPIKNQRSHPGQAVETGAQAETRQRFLQMQMAHKERVTQIRLQEQARQRKLQEKAIASEKQQEDLRIAYLKAQADKAAKAKQLKEQQARNAQFAEQQRIATEERLEEERLRIRKEQLRNDSSALFRHYTEYLRHFPLAKGEIKSSYHNMLLANRPTPYDPDSDLKPAIEYAKVHWELFYEYPKHVKIVDALLKEKRDKEAAESAEKAADGAQKKR
jgi:hypothetical protein